MKGNRKIFSLIFVLTLALIGLGGLAFQATFTSHARPAQTGPTIYALTTANNLISFNASTPGTIASTVAISGLAQG
ncbi:MAG: hypothetical protein ACREBD_26030, partial [Blastocatellia bacterium]